MMCETSVSVTEAMSISYTQRQKHQVNLFMALLKSNAVSWKLKIFFADILYDQRKGNCNLKIAIQYNTATLK